MRRGDLVPVAVSGDFGKPRPALLIQSDLFQETGTVTVLLISGEIVDAPLIRLTVPPTEANGLKKISQLMIDKAMSAKRDKLGIPFGRLDDETMLSATRLLAVFLNLA
ncbi:type II toxin-antitoxin system PemK/MazF family toxin [Neorhizobium alkalisoli]|uniref:Transcriptional modulator of MazE/toxin MazF n=1 Tax=Neorhizobium alkalisoli TaxID=528178 RepID=A0A561R3U5_9HYPH|nr:type II toxin-antitoxin system PemK/MazF family toxin [Neorhizobium alkalisoli]TWF57271.1 transcriptional modulator of MazE/toxin MazF [Neorhizobium alkalisoli]